MQRKRPIVNPFFHQVSKLVKTSGSSVDTLATGLVAKARPAILKAAQTGKRVVIVPLGNDVLKAEVQPNILKKTLRNSGLDGFWIEVAVRKNQLKITLPKK
jgi:hypothetical protein